MLPRGLRSGTHFLSSLKKKGFKEERATKNRVGRPRHIHDPGIQQEPLPEALQDSPVAEKLEAICALDLDELEAVDLPRGFGRD